MRFEQNFLENHSEEALLQELKRVADLHPARMLTKALFDANARCSSSAIQRRFGSWKEALNRAGIADRYKGPPECPLADNSDEAILQELKRVAGLLPEGLLTPKFFNTHGHCSSSYVIQRLGTWRNALQRAGLDTRYGGALRRMPNCDKQRYFVNLLQEAAKKQGKESISLFDFDAAQLGVSSSAIRKHFGSWSNALSAAGLNAKRTWKNPIFREECFANLSALWKALGRQPAYSELKQPYLGPKPYERIWGNFSNAIVEFRKTPEGQECLRLFPDERSDTHTRGLDKDGLLMELKRVAVIVGGNEISKADVLKHSRIDPRTFERRFGSWENAIGEAGLEIAGTAKRYTDNELFTNLMETWEALGHRPSYAEMSLPVSRNPAATYAHRFGSWRKAVLAFLQWVEKDQPEEGDTYPVTQSIGEGVSTEPSPVAVEAEPLVLPNGQRDRRRTATNKQRFRILKRDGYRCCICGHSQSDGRRLEVDHRLYPWTKGGRTIDANLWTLCDICNSGKGIDDL
ncbi:MAG: homing endonuclease associated repeat-containing protein [Thermodesulfobacteriota bacterium]